MDGFGTIGDIASIFSVFLIAYAVLQNLFIERDIALLKKEILNLKSDAIPPDDALIEEIPETVEDPRPPEEDRPHQRELEKILEKQEEDHKRLQNIEEHQRRSQEIAEEQKRLQNITDTAPQQTIPEVTNQTLTPIPLNNPTAKTSKIVEAYHMIKSSIEQAKPSGEVERVEIQGYISEAGMEDQLMKMEMEIFQKRFKSEMDGVIDG